MTVTGEDDVESDNDDTDDGGYDTDVNTDPRNQKHIFELAQGAIVVSWKKGLALDVAVLAIPCIRFRRSELRIAVSASA